MKLSRKQAKEALETIPMSAILGKTVSNGLTHKQKEFAKGIAMGATKADAYRSAYDVTSQRTLNVEPYMLARDPRIAKEIEAYTLAIEAAKHRTPAALRDLVIQSLVSVVIDPDAKQSVRVAAAKVLGTVTEVAAFTERKEVRTITSSADTRAKIMGELRQLMSATADDATIIESQAAELLAELEETHPPATPQDGDEESQISIHSTPHEPPPPLAEPPHTN